MSTGIDESQQQTTASLVTGILADLQMLIEQEIRLARKEIEEGVQRRLIAVRLMLVGGVICFLGAILGSFAASHLLFWLASSAAETTAGIPLWACHAIVGTAAIVTGIVLMRLGQNKFQMAGAPSSTSIITQE